MKPSILLVDDNPEMIRLLASMLEETATLRFATNGLTALALIRQTPPDLVLLDAEMPGISGYEVCNVIKSDPRLADIPIIFITAHHGTEFELKGLDAGAADFIAKPISRALLLARVRTQLRVKRLTDELRQMATTDALTQVQNRRCFDEALNGEWRRSWRNHEAISLILLDIDHFKLYNDFYGHPAGDECLRSIGHVLRQISMRPADLVARYGGEEFVLLLPQTTKEGAIHLAHRILSGVKNLCIPHQASLTASHVTVSIGIGFFNGPPEIHTPFGRSSTSMMDDLSIEINASKLLLSADKALYSAKHAGRAQAWALNLMDVMTPELAHPVAQPSP